MNTYEKIIAYKRDAFFYTKIFSLFIFITFCIYTYSITFSVWNVAKQEDAKKELRATEIRIAELEAEYLMHIQKLSKKESEIFALVDTKEVHYVHIKKNERVTQKD
jgi:hypothetical protein